MGAPLSCAPIRSVREGFGHLSALVAVAGMACAVFAGPPNAYRGFRMAGGTGTGEGQPRIWEPPVWPELPESMMPEGYEEEWVERMIAILSQLLIWYYSPMTGRSGDDVGLTSEPVATLATDLVTMHAVTGTPDVPGTDVDPTIGLIAEALDLVDDDPGILDASLRSELSATLLAFLSDLS